MRIKANIIILGYIAYQQSAVNKECKATCFVVTILWTPASFGVMLAHRLCFPHSNHVVLNELMSSKNSRKRLPRGKIGRACVSLGR